MLTLVGSWCSEPEVEAAEAAEVSFGIVPVAPAAFPAFPVPPAFPAANCPAAHQLSSNKAEVELGVVVSSFLGAESESTAGSWTI